MTPMIVDAQVLAQLELEKYIEEQSDEIAPEYEVDAVLDKDFGSLYRLWLGSKLLGTFYRTVCDDKWIAQTYCSSIRYRLNTAKEAQQTIISLNNLPFGNAT